MTLEDQAFKVRTMQRERSLYDRLEILEAEAKLDKMIGLIPNTLLNDDGVIFHACRYAGVLKSEFALKKTDREHALAAHLVMCYMRFVLGYKLTHIAISTNRQHASVTNALKKHKINKSGFADEYKKFIIKLNSYEHTSTSDCHVKR